MKKFLNIKRIMFLSLALLLHPSLAYATVLYPSYIEIATGLIGQLIIIFIIACIMLIIERIEYKKILHIKYFDSLSLKSIILVATSIIILDDILLFFFKSEFVYMKSSIRFIIVDIIAFIGVIHLNWQLTKKKIQDIGKVSEPTIKKFFIFHLSLYALLLFSLFIIFSFTNPMYAEELKPLGFNIPYHLFTFL